MSQANDRSANLKLYLTVYQVQTVSNNCYVALCDGELALGATRGGVRMHALFNQIQFFRLFAHA